MKRIYFKKTIIGLAVIWAAYGVGLHPGMAEEIGTSGGQSSSGTKLKTSMDGAASKEELDKLLRAFQESQKTVQQLQKTVAKQGQIINELQQKQAGVPPASGSEQAATASKEKTATDNTASKAEVEELKQKVESVSQAQKKTLMSEFNPAIGVVGESVMSYRSEGSQPTGSDRPGGFDFNQRSMELNMSASVDPFAKGYAVVNASADSATGEMTLRVEEAALQTTSLPGNLELKAGRFFAEFGRLAYIHDHELPFVNRPLVLDKYIGGESKTDGLQVNWLVPIPHYVSWSVGVGDQFGDNPNNPGGYRAFNEMNFWSRLSTYFDLAPNWQLETGASGLFNPRTDDRGGVQAQPNGSTLTEHERRIVGGDLKVSYVPLRDNQFRSLTWGTEVLYSKNRYLVDPDGTPGTGDEYADSIGSLGAYTYLTWKFSRQWSTGFLFDWMENAQNQADRTTAYSPYLTLALSHWNQLRLQYTHTDHNVISGLRSDDAIYLQWTWIIGSHSHGWQQR